MFFKPEDFGKQWQDQTKQLQDQMEKIFVEKINEMVRNPALLSAVSKSLETSFDSKTKANDAIAEFMKKMNIPTKHETGRIMQYLQQVEARILDLDEKLDALIDRLDRQPKAAEPSAVSNTTSVGVSGKVEAKKSSAKSVDRKPAAKAGKAAKSARRKS